MRPPREHGELMRQPDLLMLQSFYSVPFQALVRFGKWDDVAITASRF